MASRVLMTISRDEVEQARLISEEKYVLDTRSKLFYAKRQGEAKGLVEGRTEEKLEIARKMKEMGLPVSQIAEVTGLSPEAIEKL